MGKVTKLNTKERDFLNSYEPTGEVRDRIGKDLNLIHCAMMDVWNDMHTLAQKLHKIRYLRVSTHQPKMDSVYKFLDKGLAELKDVLNKETDAVDRSKDSGVGSDILDQLDAEIRKVEQVQHDLGFDFDDYNNGGTWDD